MKKYLMKLIETKEKRVAELKKQIKAAETADEVRSLGETLDAVLQELADAKEQLEKVEKDEGDGDGDNGDGNGNGDGGTQRQQIPQNAQLRNGNLLAAYSQNPPNQQRTDDIGFGSMEYRQAFMSYVQRGTPIPADVMKRAGGDEGVTLTSEIGAIIPTTIMNEFIKDVSKVRGNIFSKVRKLNVKGGVKFPISKLKANFNWINESEVSKEQKAGEIKDFVVFEYNIGEVRIAESLLAQVVSLDIFESEITKIMIEAYLEAMDKGIISGTGSGQLLGITKDTRVTGNEDHIIEMTAADFADWTAWRKKLFAKIPLSKRGQGEFLFPSSTVESYLMTMKDNNNRPLFKEATDLNMGNTVGSFFGRTTDLVEPDVIPDFDTAGDGDIVGIYWVPNDYAINTNMEFGVKRYFDDKTNEWINKGLTIVDGKILDVSGCYLIKKKASK